MAVFDDGALAPEVHCFESLQRLRVAGEVVERVRSSDYARGGRGVPNVISEQRNRLVAKSLAVGVDDKFIGDRIEELGSHMIVAVQRSHNDVFYGEILSFDVFGNLFAGVGEVGTFADDLVFEVLGMFDEEKITKDALVFFGQKSGVFSHCFPAAFLVGESEDDAVVRESSVFDGGDGGVENF